jgi:hypothetical protein
VVAFPLLPGDFELSLAQEDSRLRNNTTNPYDPPNAAPTKAGASRDTARMRAIFCVHLVAIVASVFVVRSETILSDRLLELLIALPLISTMIICPIAILFVAIVSIRRTILFRGFLVGGDLLLSVIQMFVWLPTVQ